MDFVVLDKNPSARTIAKFSVVLGRPFLAISNTLINCQNVVIQILSGKMTVQLHIFNASQQSQDENDGIGGVNCLHERVENVDQ